MENNRVIIMEASEVIRMGLKSILEKQRYDVILFENAEIPAEHAWWEDCFALIVNPSAPVHSEEHLRHLRQEAINHGFKLIALVYAYFDEHILSLFDEVIYINDSETHILDKLKRQSEHIHDSYFAEETASLSQRELDVIRLVALGYSNREIAESLFISIHTVISHRKNITAKLGIKSASGLTIYAVINKLVSPEDFEKTSGLRLTSQL